VLAALVAGYFKSLPLTTRLSRAATAAAEIGPAGITTGLTTLRMSQVTFPVILLFPFGEHERRVALRARYF
jgi:hypothetical protein